jgi:hypothetical protein
VHSARMPDAAAVNAALHLRTRGVRLAAPVFVAGNPPR